MLIFSIFIYFNPFNFKTIDLTDRPDSLYPLSDDD